MIAVDTNVLVHAHRRDATRHAPAVAAVAELAEARALWAIPWPCVHEFIAVVTHPRIYRPATPLASALDQVSAWIESPTLVLLAETAGYRETLDEVARGAQVVGAKVHDARIAALCLLHGVSELWTADRDFTAFPRLAVRNPLVAT